MSKIKKALLIVANSDKSEPIAQLLSELGWQVTVANTTVALREVFRRSFDYHATLIDARLRADDAARVLSSVLTKLTAKSRVLVAPTFLDKEALDRLEKEGSITRLKHDISDVSGVVAQLTAPDRGSEPVKYDINVINCFVSSTNDVLDYYVGEKPEHGKAAVVPAKKTPMGFLTSVVTFLGPSEKCTASLTCDRAFIVDVASRVNGTPAAEIAEDRPALFATAEELTDQIFHKAELLLGKIGFDMKMGAIQVYGGEGEEVTVPSTVPVVVIPFTLKRKKFTIGFSIERL